MNGKVFSMWVPPSPPPLPTCACDADEPPHVCPYSDEIHNNQDMCRCCDACQRQCARDI